MEKVWHGVARAVSVRVAWTFAVGPRPAKATISELSATTVMQPSFIGNPQNVENVLPPPRGFSRLRSTFNNLDNCTGFSFFPK
jgi:hypothetical protein